MEGRSVLFVLMVLSVMALAAFITVASFIPTAVQATVLTECGVIGVPGTYTLSGNVSAAGGGCFEIAASDVTLDCGCYAIKKTDSLSGSGVMVDFGAANVVIQNCTIECTGGGAESGITINGGGLVVVPVNVGIYGNNISNCGLLGIGIPMTISNVWVRHNYLNNDGALGSFGAITSGGHSSVFTDNYVENGNVGLWNGLASSDNYFGHNSFRNNTNDTFCFGNAQNDNGNNACLSNEGCTWLTCEPT